MLKWFDDHEQTLWKLAPITLLLHLPPDELGQKVDGDGEHDGAVALRRDVVEGLQVAQLRHETIVRENRSASDIGATWRAAGQSLMISAACLSALLAWCSPSAAITLALASRAASASAAMARWRDSGTLTSFTSTLSTYTPQGSVASSRLT